jgi:hypothetical protein
MDKKSIHEAISESNRAGVQFLITDLEAALTFLDVADVTHSDENRARNRGNAMTVYETVLRLLPKVTPTEDERQKLEDRFSRLKKRLIALGQIDREAPDARERI